MTLGFEGLLQPGDRAPDFTLSSVQTDGSVSLADYRNGKGLLLGLFRGLSTARSAGARSRKWRRAPRS